MICCYFVVSLAQTRLALSRSEQLLCIDAEISAALLLAHIDGQVVGSQFDWTLRTNQALPASEIATLLANAQWSKRVDTRYQINIGTQQTPVLSGYANQDNPLFQLESLLEVFLLTDKLSYEEKYNLIEHMSCLSMVEVAQQIIGLKTGITLVYSAHSEYGFIWKDSPSSMPVYLSIVQENTFSSALMVVVVVGVGICIMLLLIWRELLSLDVKREAFESITRQIARGRSGLPKGVPDSSGTLKELAYSFDSMSSHIQRLLKVQREMINAISHELRTPIARLRFGLEVMKDEVNAQAGKSIEALEGDVEELNTLVDEVLTYGKLEDGSLELSFEELSIIQLVDAILENNHLLLQHLTVTVKIEAQDHLVLADEHHLSRALQNLILNAAKYASSRIVLTFSSDAERWQLDIEDDGPGIPIEDRDKVFIPFQRLDNSRTRASGGYGLGLAIVQRIAFWHGGAVLIDESETGGAKFSLIWSRVRHQNALS
ncbi:ATP-binding protein [Marinomonas sp. IMCC 4694]|uniref:ATP-binding protein n=1 Tax=Marinomonas sp. IMCC 4694 TaxID=2605432 RepID=UPI0011E848AA|nr:ATP-binding protein [Marinomonas sp. IMCC 4694]TYL48453.1 two-component sensor histidine kinase [Marinomonas sp. IMCC 4694]